MQSDNAIRNSNIKYLYLSVRVKILHVHVHDQKLLRAELSPKESSDFCLLQRSLIAADRARVGNHAQRDVLNVVVHVYAC